MTDAVQTRTEAGVRLVRYGWSSPESVCDFSEVGWPLYQRLGIHSQQGVAGLIGRTLAEVDVIPFDQPSLTT